MKPNYLTFVSFNHFVAVIVKCICILYLLEDVLNKTKCLQSLEPVGLGGTWGSAILTTSRWCPCYYHGTSLWEQLLYSMFTLVILEYFIFSSVTPVSRSSLHIAQCSVYLLFKAKETHFCIITYQLPDFRISYHLILV